MAEYEPTVWTKDGEERTAYTPSEAVQLEFDGWVPVGDAEPDSRWFTPDQTQEIRELVERKVYVGADDPEFTAAGVWFKTLPSGETEIWVEDGL